ncbi:MAG TPA: lysylphosphatidylglycerol synthase transmembrane domain-containing protein [Chloroflexota bacterium]|nr:lysylphosphatidylglycerol synthase transmembrane domain-containing protein [Chloroflexota bacterium]
MATTDTSIDEQAEWPPAEEQRVEAELSIGNRLHNWKSVASFGVAILIFAFVIYKAGIDPATLWARIRTINLGLFVAAFFVYYSTFPLRGYRWKMMIDNAYRDEDPSSVSHMTVRGLTEIIYISWFVNCVVPAKLGDLYRAYLAKLWARVSWAKTVGTILAERLLDILVLSFLLALTGFIVFHSRLGQVGVLLILGVGLAVVGILVLVGMRLFSSHIRRLVPARFAERYVSFEEGTLQSFRRLPLLLGLTAIIWMLEGGRLQLVFLSLGIHPHITNLPYVPMLFFALGTAVLTTLPITPGGLGVVEAGLGSLMIYLGIPTADAAAVVLVDRLLSYYSIAILGFIVYLVSKRSHFRAHA